ncbi:MAG: orotidine-5'-phosphate decarboxylase [Deltaproteobacteria bacterium CG11_big_fil_rev_8_21_14_0_20_45_16]|nr:MAG: orotidine-5'-phosphate decarboxylase [Deltaproteobacteria bacterium CG11_big_fil_rev_8_21_14_0_20_45_16]
MSEPRAKLSNSQFNWPLPVVVALDQPWDAAQDWLDRLQGKIWGFKVGSILYMKMGPQIIEILKSKGFKVFLDLKFHDIPNTVGRATREAFSQGVDWLTVHGSGGPEMLRAAANEQRDEQLVLSVSVLTSLNQADLTSININDSLEDHFLKLAQLSQDAGIRGLIASPHELGLLKTRFPGSLLVVPGVHIDEPAADQKRSLPVSEALKRGADFVVLGRALYEAENWEIQWKKLCSSLGVTY